MEVLNIKILKVARYRSTLSVCTIFVVLIIICCKMPATPCLTCVVRFLDMLLPADTGIIPSDANNGVLASLPLQSDLRSSHFEPVAGLNTANGAMGSPRAIPV